jgi:hypothetical protein
MRYLPAGVKAGSKTRYLTIGTYPVKGALANIKAASKRSGAVRVDAASGGFGFYAESSPSSVHLAYPGKNYPTNDSASARSDPAPCEIRAR